MNFYEKFNSKLYNPRDIEGNPNSEMFRAVDIVYETLTGEEDFVAVEPFGSTMKGYSNKDSDFDIRILVDVKDKMDFKDNDDTDEMVTRGSEVYHRTEKIKNKAIKALEDGGFDSEKLHILIFVVSKKANVARIENGLNKDESDARVVGALFKIFKGERINDFRDSAIAELRKLSEPELLRQTRLMAVALSESELLSFNKIKQRAGNDQDYDSLLEGRIQMWKNRILGFIN